MCRNFFIIIHFIMSIIDSGRIWTSYLSQLIFGVRFKGSGYSHERIYVSLVWQLARLNILFLISRICTVRETSLLSGVLYHYINAVSLRIILLRRSSSVCIFPSKLNITHTALLISTSSFSTIDRPYCKYRVFEMFRVTIYSFAK